MSESKQTEPVTVFSNFAISVGALMLILWMAEDARFVRDFRLIRGAITVEGRVTETGNDEDCDEEGCWGGDYADYIFRHNGETVDGRTHFKVLPEEMREDERVKIEYLSSEPKVNRIAGTGIQTKSKWIRAHWFSVLAIAVMCGLCLFYAGKNLWTIITFPTNPLPQIIGSSVYFIFTVGVYCISVYFVWRLCSKLFPESLAVMSIIIGMFVSAFPVLLIVYLFNLCKEKLGPKVE